MLLKKKVNKNRPIFTHENFIHMQIETHENLNIKINDLIKNKKNKKHIYIYVLHLDINM